MSDFSLFSLFTAGLALMVPFTSAYTKPVGQPNGNPIAEPGLNSLLPAGKGFAVMWKPTTQGTVTLVLLKGPSADAQPIGVIAENIDNNGTYVWTPSKDLQPSANNQPDGYGIQLIDDKTGQYQYSTQFGISNPSWKQGESWDNLGSSSSSSASASASGPSPYQTSKTTKTTEHTTPAPHKPTTSPWKPQNVTIVSSTGWKPHTTSLKTATSSPATSSAASTGWQHTSTSQPSPTTAPNTNGASTFASSFVGLVVAAGVAVFAL